MTEERGVVEVVGEVVVYIPDPNLVGTDRFTYRVTDPYGAWAEATVVVTVRAPTTPVRTVVSVTPSPDGTVSVKLLGIPNRTYSVE